LEKLPPAGLRQSKNCADAVDETRANSTESPKSSSADRRRDFAARIAAPLPSSSILQAQAAPCPASRRVPIRRHIE
jgi:hypothetical protein